MSKWVAIMSQKGEGCDYTIGCGVKTAIFEAESLPAAKQTLISKMGMDEYFSGECDATYYTSRLDFWSLFEVTSELDMLQCLKKAAKDYTTIRENIVKLKQEEHEKAEYQRLKAKFENK